MYKGLSKHQEIHDAMRLHVAQIVKGVEVAPENALAEILNFFTMWLLDHISTEDKMMAKFVSNQLILQPSGELKSTSHNLALENSEFREKT